MGRGMKPMTRSRWNAPMPRARTSSAIARRRTSNPGKEKDGMLIRGCWALLVLCAWAQPTAPPSNFWGCWVVRKALPTAGISGLSPAQEKAMIARRIVFTPACARSGGRVIRRPKYSATVLSDREFFQLGYVRLGGIGIQEDGAEI